MTKGDVHAINVYRSWDGLAGAPMYQHWLDDQALVDGLPPPPPTGFASTDAAEQFIADHHA